MRFEGLPGEYTQFDFGECEVKTAAGLVRVQFFAGRLKFSRYMHAEVVLDPCAETLVRSVLGCVAAFGGSSEEWVFDNPKTVRISKRGVEPPVLHRYLAQLVAEYRVIPTLCAPRSGKPEGLGRTARRVRQEQLPAGAEVRGSGRHRTAARGLAARGEPRAAV